MGKQAIAPREGRLRRKAKKRPGDVGGAEERLGGCWVRFLARSTVNKKASAVASEGEGGSISGIKMGEHRVRRKLHEKRKKGYSVSSIT